MDPATFLLENREFMSGEEIAPLLETGSEKSPAARLNNAFPAIPETSEGFIGRVGQSLNRGVQQGKEIAGGLTMMAGETVGSQGLKDLGEEMAIDAERQTIKNQSIVPSYSDISNVGDFFEYATSSIMEMLPMNIALLATGVGGAGIAGKIATGAFRGAITKEVAAGVTEEMIAKFGAEGAKQEFAKIVARDAASKAAQQTGAKIGVGAGSSLVETGSNAATINRETGSTGGMSTAVLGIAGGATDILGGEAKALTNVLKGSAKDQAIGAVKHVAKNVGEVVASEVPQELVQNTISQTALQIETPNKNQFGQEFLKEQVETVFKTALGASPLGVISGVATLPPSADPMVRGQEADIANKINAKLPDDIQITPEDEAAAAEAQKPETASVSPSESGSAQVEDPNQKLIIANDNLARITKELDTVLLSDEPNPEEETRLQEGRKQALLEIKSLQSQIAGYDLETGTKKGKARKLPKEAPFAEFGLPAPNHDEASKWLDSLFTSETDPIKLSANLSIKSALKPFVSMIHAVGGKVVFNEGSPNAKTNRSNLSWDDEGNLTMQVNRQQAEKLTPQRFAKEVEEEYMHGATVLADRINWLKAARPMSFKEFAAKQSAKRAESIRRSSSNQAIQSLSLTYTGGKSLTEFDVTGKDAKGIREANIALDREFTRAILQKMRTGKITEDLKILEREARSGNAEADTFLQQLLQAIRNIKEVLITYINPKTAPKDIKALLAQSNEILDKYADRTKPQKSKPVATSEKASAPDTLPEEQKPAAVNVEPKKATPEGDEATNQPEAAASAGPELFTPTEYGQYFETQDFRGAPTGTTLIRTEVANGQDPEEAIKATQKYRDLKRRGKAFHSGASFEIPSIVDDKAGAGQEISDWKKQSAYSDSEAKAQGYKDITAMALDEEGGGKEQYKALAERWRMLHPKDDEGNLTTEDRAERVESTLYPGGTRGDGAADTLVDAAADFRRSERQRGHGSTVPEGSSDLKEWADKNDRVITELPFVLDGPLDKGNSEQHAYHDEPSQRWIKLTKWDDNGFGQTVVTHPAYGWGTGAGTVSQYLDRLALQNEKNGDDVRFHGVYFDKAGRPHLVTSQPDIVGTPATTEEISRRMKDAGFQEVGNNAYYREIDNLLLADMHEGNSFLVEGTLVPFDAIAIHPEGEILDAILNDMAATRLDKEQDVAASGSEIPEYEAEFVDGLLAGLRGVENVMKANGAKDKRPTKSKMATYGGAFSPYLNTRTRAQFVSVEAAENYLRKYGYLGAMRRAEGSMGSMHPADKTMLRGYLANQYDAYREYVDMLDMTHEERQELIKEAANLRDDIQRTLIERSTEKGQEIGILKVLKNFFYNGTAAAYDAKVLLFNAAQKVEQSLGLGDIKLIHEAVKGAMPKAIDEVFTSRELMAHLSAMTRAMTNNPSKLFTRIRASIKENKAGRRAAWQAAARIGNEIMREGGEFHLDTIVKRVANIIENNQPLGAKKSGRNILSETLTKFAKDNFPKEKITATKTNDRNLQILATIIANDKLKNQFVTELENKIAEGYIGGKNSAGFKRDYAGRFDEMREEGWSEGIRIRALSDVKKKLGLTIGKMISAGAWSDEKAKVVAEVKKVIGAFTRASDAQIEALVNEINSDLDRQSEEHMEKTFLFKKNEDGTFQTTDKGQLKGGANLVKILRELQTTLKQLTKDSYNTQDSRINQLATDAVNKLGLPTEMAMKYQQLFAAELRKATEWTKNAELKKRYDAVVNGLNNKKEKPETKSVIDKLVELANQGYLSDELIYDSIRKSYKNSKLPAFDPSIAEMIRDWGNEMDALPEGALKDSIRQEIANAIANSTPFTKKELLTSYWYFSLLSGPSTYLVANPVGNAANLVGQTLAMSVDNPKAAGRIIARTIQELVNPDSTSWNRFRYTMETGLVPIEVSAKYGSGELKRGTITEMAQLPVERISNESADTWWKKAYYVLARGVKIGNVEISMRGLSRFMAATDMLFRGAGYAGALEWQGVQITPQMLKDAREQAAAEVGAAGGSNALISVRADEIIRQDLSLRDTETQWKIERAEQIGLETAYAQRPKGMIGSLANFIGELGNKYTPVKLIFPFTNIVANVWNESLNYTPVGLMRFAVAKHQEGKNQKGDWTIVDDKGNNIADSIQVRKSIIGAATALLLGAIFSGDDDDDFELVGFGPTNKRDRAMFFERGMRPYSMRFGNTVVNYLPLGPLASLIGTVGTMLDLKKQNRDKKQGVTDNASNLAFGFVASIATSQLSQSFFSSASSMFQAIYSPSPGSGVQRWVAGQVGTIVPNAIKQINADFINNGIYRSSSFRGQIMASMGVTKTIGNFPALNVYGEPVKNKKTPIIGRVLSVADSGGLMSEIDQLGLSIPLGSARLQGVDMTDEQEYLYRSSAGPILKRTHQTLLPTLSRLVGQGKIQEAQDLLDNATAKVNQGVKASMVRKLRP